MTTEHATACRNMGGAPLFGRFFGNDDETIFRQHMGMGRGGVYTFCAGNLSCNDSFTWQVPNAVFIGGPGAIGAYIGNADEREGIRAIQ